ncbi:unnamed protein product [Meloidogyne enterolobii]|uniref:Uncharacterized protein n=1 Tax=Meloidogyne enterolobii TaxID=390850 RepID=A0ACB0Z6X3_MELEN
MNNVVILEHDVKTNNKQILKLNAEMSKLEEYKKELNDINTKIEDQEIVQNKIKEINEELEKYTEPMKNEVEQFENQNRKNKKIIKQLEKERIKYMKDNEQANGKLEERIFYKTFNIQKFSDMKEELGNVLNLDYLKKLNK